MLFILMTDMFKMSKTGSIFAIINFHLQKQLSNNTDNSHEPAQPHDVTKLRLLLLI